MKTKKMVMVAVLTSLALVISLFEHYFPVPLGIPGAKLGLSNLILLTTILLYGGREGLLLAVAKSFLLLLLTGAVTSFFYSLAGAVSASCVMSVAAKRGCPPLSEVGVSVLGSFSHNLAQIGVAALVLQNRGIFYYLPLMTLVGTATGIFVGLTSRFLTLHLKKLHRLY